MLEELKQFATERQCQFIDAILKHGSQRAAARALGVSECTIRGAMNSVKKKAALRGYSPEHDMSKVVPDGYMVKGTSTLYDAESKPVMQWVKSSINAERQKEIMEAAFQAMAAELPREKASTYQNRCAYNKLCDLIVFTDYHFGMLAWGKEAGHDWDIKIAEELLIKSMEHLINVGQPASKLVLTIQGDFLHSDGLMPLTPAHKHILDTDGRFSKIVASAIRVLRIIINRALESYREVHLVICEGNHDEASSVWLRHMFAALHENEPRLSVNNSELPFYVYQHGEVMLAFHHGHKVKNEHLPMLFAAQYSKIWGQSRYRYCHTGHRHHVDEKEYSGMIVTQHPTLAARDSYAARGGWIANRGATITTYHEKFGLVSKSTVTPEMFE